MLIFHPALLRMFVYAAIQIKNDLCQSFSWRVKYLQHQNIYDHFRRSGDVLFNYAKHATHVLLEEWLKGDQLTSWAFDHISGLIEWIVTAVGIFNLSAVSSILKTILLYGAKLASRSLAEAVKWDVYSKNLVGVVTESSSLFFDWNECARKVMVNIEQQHDILPCPGQPQTMCYAHELQNKRTPVKGKGTLMRWVECSDNPNEFCYEETLLDLEPCSANKTMQCLREQTGDQTWMEYFGWKKAQPGPCPDDKMAYCINNKRLQPCLTNAERLCYKNQPGFFG
jgi:hypothetical protein